MPSKEEDYWLQKRRKYASEQWANQPSLFAQTALGFLTPEGKILELGAGLGQDGIWFATQGFDVTQTDLAIEEMLPIPGNVALTRTRLDLSHTLPYVLHTYDAVYACLSLHYFDWDRTERLFDEIFETLKPGGVFAMLVNSVNDPEYNTGTKLEEDYFEVDGINKRYFDLASVQRLTQRYKPLLFDDKGTSYKDQEKGISNLVRFIGEKG